MASPGWLSTRLQPNHPSDSPRGITASILDGLLLGSGDAVIGINPASDNTATIGFLIQLTAEIIEKARHSERSPCVLAHATTQIEAIRQGLAGGPGLLQSIAVEAPRRPMRASA